jgi:cell division GTPase FtsZ
MVTKTISALHNSKADVKIHLGNTTTGGLGAGADPSKGEAAANESRDDISQALEGADMETMTAFRDYLTSHGLFTTIRASRGEDIFAACGMLSTAKQEGLK